MLHYCVFSSDTSNFALSTRTKKRSVIRTLLRQAAAKLSTGKFTLTDTSEFLKFLDEAVRDQIKDKIEVIQPGTLGVSLATSETFIYCPFVEGGSQIFTDLSGSAKSVFTMGLSATVYTLAVNGNHQDMSGADQEGQFYTYVHADSSKETTFVWGSATVSTNATSSGEASGDPYIRTILV